LGLALVSAAGFSAGFWQADRAAAMDNDSNKLLGAFTGDGSKWE
jgi:hypothetical protein